MAKIKRNQVEDEGPAPIDPIYEHITGRSYEVDYGPLRGERHNYVRVLNTEAGFLYVQPITADGKDTGERYWLSSSIVAALRPLN